VRHKQVRSAIQQVHSKEVGSTPNPFAAIVRHEAIVLALGERRTVPRFFQPHSCLALGRDAGITVSHAAILTSVPEWDRQFHLVRVHHEHREELGRLRLAGIGAGSPGRSEKLCVTL